MVTNQYQTKLLLEDQTLPIPHQDLEYRIYNEKNIKNNDNEIHKKKHLWSTILYISTHESVGGVGGFKDR